jgi:hypothetical protein
LRFLSVWKSKIRFETFRENITIASHVIPL